MVAEGGARGPWLLAPPWPFTAAPLGAARHQRQGALQWAGVQLAGQRRAPKTIATAGGMEGGVAVFPGSCSVVQRTHSLPVHTSPQALLAFPQECPVPGTDLEINPTLESLCLSMTEHALGDGADKTSTI